MATAGGYRAQERLGLVIAVALHAGLFALLLLRPPRVAPPPAPDRIAVTLSDDVGLTATSPGSAARAAPDLAPTLGQARSAPPPASVPSAAPVTSTPARAKPPRSMPAIAALAKTPPRVEPVPEVGEATSRERAADVARTAQLNRREARVMARAEERRAGGARVGADFLRGVADDRGTEANPIGVRIDGAARASLASAIASQLRPNWAAPQGADAELLVTVLSWDLDPNGNLVGPPRVVRQDGVTAANASQASRHAEQAVRAVELAAPFDLPPQYYPAWRHVARFRFDKRLSQ